MTFRTKMRTGRQLEELEQCPEITKLVELDFKDKGQSSFSGDT